MPTAWLGSWYQRGMSSLLEITIDHIQTKGRCLDALPIEQYYLFTDRINRCTRCLLFIERHTNLLQYRESECSDADDLSSATSCPNMIAPDATLYTLHRNNSKPQLCPIQPPYLLTNFIKDGSICHQSISSSYIGECANDYQFHLHLSSCSSYYQTFDLELICVGTWIEGFHTYFVTRILSKQHHYNNNQYACFHFITKQKDISSSFLLSMATDDSCRDLNSKYMATVMTLSSINRQISNESNLSCIFPDEFQQYEWYSLNHTIQMIITNNNIELINLQEKEINKRFYCLQSINSLNYRIQSFINCHINEECLQFNRRTNNVLELILNNCNNNNKYNKTLTFITKSNDLLSCPTTIGYLLLESNFNYYRQFILRDKIFQMSVGCDNKEKLMIYQTDKDPEYRSLTQTDTCLASWQSDDLSMIYLIAQSIYSNASYCLNFQMSNSIIIRNNSDECSFNNYEDKTSISIYSAKLINPCSQSQRLLLKYILLLITIFLSINNIR